jgi:uncharacterized membrane protein
VTIRKRLLLAIVLAATLVVGVVVPALAFGGGTGGGFSGGGGGGGGGGGFGGGGGGFGGGGFGFPLFFPFLGFGGGSLIPILLFLFLFWLSRNAGSRGGRGLGLGLGSGMGQVQSPDVNVIRLEIGLLSTANEVPTALHRIVASSNTSTPTGLSALLQDSALLLLRNQQYWHAASYSYQKVRFNQAESTFNSLTVQARSKLGYETITNINGVLQQGAPQLARPSGAGSAVPAAGLPPGDYIVVVLIVASSAPLRPRPATTAEQIRDQLSEIAAAAGSNVEGVEVIWQPDSSTEALSRDDLITMYPELAPI